MYKRVRAKEMCFHLNINKFNPLKTRPEYTRVNVKCVLYRVAQ